MFKFSYVPPRRPILERVHEIVMAGFLLCCIILVLAIAANVLGAYGLSPMEETPCFGRGCS